ncbi:MAG: DegV family protein, partial [Clostridia bacterium]|nr:DegV family protein [Clostridia bacterium]
MKKIAIVTDSHSSISPIQADMMGIHVLPMPFDIDGQDYVEGVNLTRQQFFGYQR